MSNYVKRYIELIDKTTTPENLKEILELLLDRIERAEEEIRELKKEKK